MKHKGEGRTKRATPPVFERQPQAAAINLAGLSEAFVNLITHVAPKEQLKGSAKAERIAELRACVSDGYVGAFDKAHDDNCRRKMGFAQWDDAAQEIYDELFGLMSSQCGTGGIDHTLFWRSLACAPPPA